MGKSDRSGAEFTGSVDDLVTHVGFADESRYTQDRYRSIGMVSLSKELWAELEAEYKSLLLGSGYNEFKWRKVDGAKRRFMGLKSIDFTVKHVKCSPLRIDVLCWDTHDQRHQQLNRDDNANLGRMYYHLFRVVVSRRWPAGSVWRLYPDNNSVVEWSTLWRCVDAGTPAPFVIDDVTPVDSAEHPLVQLADFYAGMVQYSRNEFQKVKDWIQRHTPQLTLFKLPEFTEGFSNADNERCRVIGYLNEKCKNLKYGVSLQTFGGLRSIGTNAPISFWWYEPQHNADKAPVKNRK